MIIVILESRYVLNMKMQVENRYKIVHVTSENTRETRETESKSVSDSDDQKVPATSSSDYALPYGFVCCDILKSYNFYYVTVFDIPYHCCINFVRIFRLFFRDMPEAMVTEAISTMDYGIGVNIDEIYEYIEVNIYRTISLTSFCILVLISLESYSLWLINCRIGTKYRQIT